MNEELFNIDVSDILSSYGLDGAINNNARMVTQQGANILVGTLEPPALTTSDDSSSDDSSTVIVEEEAPIEDSSITNEEPHNDELSDIIETITPTEEGETGLIPLNNEKILEEDDSTLRFSGAEWFKQIQEEFVTLVGCGGIGSFVYFCLCRVKPAQITIFDEDTVEYVNLSGQLFGRKDVNHKKVDRMFMVGVEYSDYTNTIAIPRKYTAFDSPSPVMICGLDNMLSRKDCFESWIHSIKNSTVPKKDYLFIDGRLAAEEFQVFCIRGDDDYNIDRYRREYLFDDSQAVDLPCSFKQTTFCSNLIGSVIVNLFINFVSNKVNPSGLRQVPFKTYYNARMMYFKTEE